MRPDKVDNPLRAPRLDGNVMYAKVTFGSRYQSRGFVSCHRFLSGPVQSTCTASVALSFVTLLTVVVSMSRSSTTRLRLSEAYHIERSISNRLGLPEYPCACSQCKGAVMKKVESVARHHRLYGRDPYLVFLVMIVDGQNVRGPAPRRDGSAEPYR